MGRYQPLHGKGARGPLVQRRLSLYLLECVFPLPGSSGHANGRLMAAKTSLKDFALTIDRMPLYSCCVERKRLSMQRIKTGKIYEL